MKTNIWVRYAEHTDYLGQVCGWKATIEAEIEKGRGEQGTT
jgi:hypothetical protein